jgi:hypothetical protein
MALILNNGGRTLLFIAYDHNLEKMEQYAPPIEHRDVRYVNKDHLAGSDYFWLCVFEKGHNVPDKIKVLKDVKGKLADAKTPNVTFGQEGSHVISDGHPESPIAAAWLKKTNGLQLEPVPKRLDLEFRFRRWLGGKTYKGGEWHGW